MCEKACLLSSMSFVGRGGSFAGDGGGSCEEKWRGGLFWGVYDIVPITFMEKIVNAGPLFDRYFRQSVKMINFMARVSKNQTRKPRCPKFLYGPQYFYIENEWLILNSADIYTNEIGEIGEIGQQLIVDNWRSPKNIGSGDFAI